MATKDSPSAWDDALILLLFALPIPFLLMKQDVETPPGEITSPTRLPRFRLPELFIPPTRP